MTMLARAGAPIRTLSRTWGRASTTMKERRDLEATISLDNLDEEARELERLRRVMYDLNDIGEPSKHDWLDLSVYEAYLRHQFGTVGCRVMKPVVELGNPSRRPDLPMKFLECIRFVSEIAELAKKTTEADTIVSRLLVDWAQQRGLANSLHALNHQEIRRCQGAIFCAFAWITLMVQVSVPDTSADGHPPENEARWTPIIVQYPEGCCLSTPITHPRDEATRPLHCFLRGFNQGPKLSQLHGDENTSTPSRERWSDSGLIHVSSVNYAMLREFGKITIEWTDVLSCHLVFIPATRTLFLFRMPSFCALGCLKKHDSCLSDHVLSERNSPQPMLHTWLQFRREVLLSYRILFGQDKRSRKLFLEMKKHSVKKRPEDDDDDDDTCTTTGTAARPSPLLGDRLLTILCTQPTKSRTIQRLPSTLWPKSSLSIDKKLRQLDEYDISSDLPVLGERLLAIQEFSLRQRAPSFWALWKDTRDKPKWYTFWVVLIVGGFTVVITVAQLVVSLAQLSLEERRAGASSGGVG